jgi:hypothetical protein
MKSHVTTLFVRFLVENKFDNKIRKQLVSHLCFQEEANDEEWRPQRIDIEEDEGVL